MWLIYLKKSYKIMCLLVNSDHVKVSFPDLFFEGSISLFLLLPYLFVL